MTNNSTKIITSYKPTLLIKKTISEVNIFFKNNIITFIILSVLFALGLFMASNLLYKNANTVNFFQAYFEPAVMMACGHGFVTTHGNAGKKLQQFLDTKTNQISCNDIKLSKKLYDNPRVGIWYYMLASTAIIWKIFGISWTSVNYLLAFLFALSLVICYGIYRLGMNPLLAFIGVIIFALIEGHANYIFSLRDYSKVPFLLFGIFLLGYLVSKPTTFKWQVTLIAALGLSIGIGYGFRPDVLILLPPAILAILFFKPEKIFINLPKNLLLILVLFSMFIISAWPMISAHNDKKTGSCFGHFAMLGLTNSFTNKLGLKPSHYGWGYKYSDEMNYLISRAYSENFLNNNSYYIPCGHKDDKVTANILGNIVKYFPADLIARTYQANINLLANNKNYLFTLLVLIIFVAIDLRIALFISIMIFYFFSTTVIQFSERHYFYLLFWYWWPIGFLLNILFSSTHKKKIVDIYNSRLFGLNSFLNIVKKSTLFFSLLFLLPSLVLYYARVYQKSQVTKIIQNYQLLPSKILTYTVIKSKVSDKYLYKLHWPKLLQLNSQTSKSQFIRTKMLKITLSGKHCSHVASYKLYYHTTNYYYDFSIPFQVDLTNENKNYNVYLPIYFVSGDISPQGTELKSEAYHGFSYPIGLESNEKDIACIKNVATVDMKNAYHVWLTLFVPSNWQNHELFHRLSK